MTRRQRLMATLEGTGVDRPPVSFYEIGGWNILAACDDRDEFNVYNAPSWRPLAQLAEEQTDVIRMVYPSWRPAGPDEPAGGDGALGSTRTEQWRQGGAIYTRRTLKLADRELTAVARRDAETMTTWTLEHFLKSVEDLKAYVELPPETFAREFDVEALVKGEQALGEAGIVMVDTADPLCAAAEMFSMADYTVVAMTEEKLFHRLLERLAVRIHQQTEIVGREFPGRLWRVVGSEYASEPYLPPALYQQYINRYTGPMVQSIRKHGGYARIHSHGRLRGIMPHIAAMKVDGLDPCEPPPQGDMPLKELRRQYGPQMVLFGNIESSDIENLQPAAFERKVVQALREGTAGQGRGFVLMPSSCPYGRTIPPHVLANYETMVRLAAGWGG